MTDTPKEIPIEVEYEVEVKRDGVTVTQIKEIWIILDTIFVLDYRDQLNFMASAGDSDNVISVAMALGQFHKKQVFALNVEQRRMVPLVAELTPRP